MKRLRQLRPSPGVIVGLIALFVALDGPAAALRGANSVFKDDIARNAVGRSEIAKNGVGKSEAGADSIGRSELREQDDRNGGLTSDYIQDGSLLAEDFGAGQLPAGAQGPKGDTGDTGPKGDTGDTGPTQGSANQTHSGGSPSASPEFNIGGTTITTTTSGRIFAFGRATLNINCDVGGPKASMYVDGTPVPASGFDFGDNVSTNVSTWGASGIVDAGTHQVTLQTDCPSGTVQGGSSASNGAAGAILLGGS